MKKQYTIKYKVGESEGLWYVQPGDIVETVGTVAKRLNSGQISDLDIISPQGRSVAEFYLAMA